MYCMDHLMKGNHCIRIWDPSSQGLLACTFYTLIPTVDLALVVQKLDNAIHQISHYPDDKCWQNILDTDLSGG